MALYHEHMSPDDRMNEVDNELRNAEIKRMKAELVLELNYHKQKSIKLKIKRLEKQLEQKPVPPPPNTLF